jgi:long-chain acyl-CoA synthetase
MVGYRKNKEANDEVFYHHEGERYFRTGDMGRMVEGKFLKITGRIKEQFKLENGKYVVPAPLEDVYCRSPYIAQMFLAGVNHPTTIALIVPNYVNLAAWCAKQGKTLDMKQLADPTTKTLDLFADPAFQELISSEVSMIHTTL